MQFITKLFERECEMALRFYIFMGKNLSKLLRDISALSQQELTVEKDSPDNSKVKPEEKPEVEILEKQFQTLFSLGEEEVLLASKFPTRYL